MATRDVQSQQDSKLLAIPPEMRNRIYRAALLEPGHIKMDANFRLPALLQVCRQIRSEALGIYFQENKFQFEVVDHDSTLLAHSKEVFEQLHDVRCVGSIRQSDNWDKLMHWLHSFYLGQCAGPIVGLDCADLNKNDTPVLLFNIADTLLASNVC